MTDPAKIVSKGMLKGHPVEAFTPVWGCAAARIARSAWVDCGLEVFLRADVPYGATSSGRLSHDAVALLLETGKKSHRCRFLEIGAGSGIFAKLFLDALKADAPDIYDNCTYILTDGNAKMLESQAEYGVLAGHEAHIETRVFDASGAWPEDFTGAFDAVFGSYILDSLPVEFLIVGESGIQRMEARCTLPAKNEALEDALKTPGFAHLAPFLHLTKSMGIQSRHMSAPTLPYASAIGAAEGEDTPMVHSHGALACMENIAHALCPGGFAMLSDYGTIARREPSETIEFQSFGASAAYAVNFHQIDAHFAAHPVSYLKPEAEEGYLITRVFYNGEAEILAPMVDLLFGEVRQRALRLPVDAAREMLRANAFHAARRLYAKAMELQPQNWALAEEVAELLLLSSKDYADAKALAEFGLSLNPFAPGLHRIVAEACFELDDMSGAEQALKTCLHYAGDTAAARLLEAKIQLKSGTHEAALLAIAKGLAVDRESDLRDALLTLQNDILLEISIGAREDLLNEVNRQRTLDGLPL